MAPDAKPSVRLDKYVTYTKEMRMNSRSCLSSLLMTSRISKDVLYLLGGAFWKNVITKPHFAFCYSLNAKYLQTDWKDSNPKF